VAPAFQQLAGVGSCFCDELVAGVAQVMEMNVKGAPSARQADRPWPRLAKDAQDERGERERAGRRAIAASW